MASTQTSPQLPVDATPNTPMVQDNGDSTTGTRKTPFAHPSQSSTIPPAPPLTTEQTTKYNSVLNTVSTWTVVPNTSAPKAPNAPLTDEELMWLTRECLLRYLRATKWDITAAVNRIYATLVWRREYGLQKLTADYISVESETGKQWILGYDNSGRPCHYLNPSRQNTPRSARQIEHLVFMLERAIDLMPPGQETLALLINFAETSKGQGATLQQGKQTLSILQNHYPERLGRSLLINLPWFFWAFMKLITPFIDPLTRQKLIFNENLRDHVPPAQLLKSHGGDLAFEYEHGIYWPALNGLVAERRALMKERWIKGGKRVGEFEVYLKGGQESSLQDTLRQDGDVDDVAEKVDGLTVNGEKKLRKSVSIYEEKIDGKDHAEEEKAAEVVVGAA